MSEIVQQWRSWLPLGWIYLYHYKDHSVCIAIEDVPEGSLVTIMSWSFPNIYKARDVFEHLSCVLDTGCVKVRAKEINEHTFYSCLAQLQDDPERSPSYA